MLKIGGAGRRWLTRSTLVVVVAGALMVAGCTSGSSPTTPSGAGSATSPPQGTPPTAPNSTAPPGTDPAAGPFCVAMAKVHDVSKAPSDSTTPTDAQLREFVDALRAARRVAPSELRDPLQVLADAYAGTFSPDNAGSTGTGGRSARGGTTPGTDPLAVLSDPRVQSALTRLTTAVNAQCGINLDDTPGAPVGSGTEPGSPSGSISPARTGACAKVNAEDLTTAGTRGTIKTGIDASKNFTLGTDSSACEFDVTAGNDTTNVIVIVAPTGGSSLYTSSSDAFATTTDALPGLGDQAQYQARTPDSGASGFDQQVLVNKGAAVLKISTSGSQITSRAALIALATTITNRL